MASNLLYLTILVVAGISLKETAAISVREAIQSKNIVLWDGVQGGLVDGYSGVRFNLASSFGKLTSKGLKMLDNSLKTMMGGILKLNLNRNYQWNDIINILNKSPLTIRRPQDKIYKNNKIHFNSHKVLGIGKSKRNRKPIIRTWFSNLIGNVDILKDAHIDLNKILDLAIKFRVNMWTKLFTHKSRTVQLMDLGILRFPDISHPFFTVYRIHLIGKCTYKTYIFYQKEYCEINGIFHKEVYYPDRKFIKSLSGDYTKELIREVEDLFKDF